MIKDFEITVQKSFWLLAWSHDKGQRSDLGRQSQFSSDLISDYFPKRMSEQPLSNPALLFQKSSFLVSLALTVWICVYVV